MLSCHAGAIGASTLVPPEAGGRPWHELRASSFVLYTDLKTSKAQALLVELEQLNTILGDLAFHSEVKPSRETVVIAFQDRRDFEEIAPKGAAAFFSPSVDPRGPTIFLQGEITDVARETVQHELTHHLLHFYLPGAPRWLHEGLAEYYETLSVHDGKAILGRYPRRIHVKLGTVWQRDTSHILPRVVVPSAAVPSVEALLASRPGDFSRRETALGDTSEESEDARRVTANYTGAWGLVHTLLHSPDYADRFAIYLTALAERRASPVAWATAFEGIDPATLAADYMATLIARDVITLQTDYTPSPAEVESTRTLDPAEVHVLWASVLPAKRALRELGDALALAPRSVDARLWAARIHSASGNPERAIKALEQALDIDPNDEQCLQLLLQIYVAAADETERSHRTEALTRAEAIATRLRPRASLASSFEALASLATRQGADDDAIELAAEAFDRDFACWSCADTLASALAHQGAYQRAYEIQSVAVNIAPERQVPPAMLDRLERYRQAAAAETSSAPAARDTTTGPG